MSLNHMRQTAVLTSIFALVSACSNGSAPPQPVNVIDLTGDAGFQGCSQPNFPPEHPNLYLLQPPRFPTDRPNGQAEVDPGDPIEAQVSVNRATRQVFIELRDGFDPSFMIASIELDTPGDQTIPVTLFPEDPSRGRYYMKVILCGFDCDERSVVFDANPDVNSRYERTLIEDGEVIQVDRTCLDFTADAGFGSGTVVIQ